MLIRPLIILISVFLGLLDSQGQVKFDCADIEKDGGVDILVFDSCARSVRTSHSILLDNAEIVFCPKGIERSSPDDVKKRWSFDWKVKFNNIFIKTSGGLVVEGINEHGFSASLMFLEKCILPEKEKELIPIGASMAVNFFIDHFKSIDTALLAVWDTRIFDDMGLECQWPFRLVLHDTAGGTAYIEHIAGSLRVYTPEAPAIVTGGPDYSRLLMVSHIADSILLDEAKRNYLHFEQVAVNNNEELVKAVADYFKGKLVESQSFYLVERLHADPGLVISRSGSTFTFKIAQTDYIPGKQISRKIF